MSAAQPSEATVVASNGTSKTPLRPLVQLGAASAAGQVLEHADEATCVAQCGSVCVIGTRQGRIWHLHPGGEVASRIQSRGERILDVDLETEGRRCVVGCADGRAEVIGVGGEEPCEPWILEHSPQRGVVASVALSPQYMAPGYEGYLVCTGGRDGRLLLHRRAGHLLVHEGEGQVARIAWRGRLVAWSNDRGVKVYDVETGQKVTYVPRPMIGDGLAVAAYAPATCELLWASTDRLLLAFGPVVKVVFMVGMNGEGSLSAEVRFSFSCAEPVCGLAPSGSSQLAVLTANPLGSRVSLSLCDYCGHVFHASEVPGLRGAFPGQLRLSFVAPHLPMIFIAPRAVMVLEVDDFSEHAMQLLERGDFEDAIRLANGVGDGVENLRHTVCIKCIVPDLRIGRFEEACLTVGRFQYLGSATWQEITRQFDRFGGVQHLAVNDVLPVPPRYERLDACVYDEVLNCLVDCPSALVAVLHWWPPDIFSSDELGARLRACLPQDLTKLNVLELEDQDRFRVEALSLLEANAGDPAFAVQLLLVLGSSDVFQLLKGGLAGDGPLVELATRSIRRLFEIDDREACILFVGARSKISVDVVVQALQGGCSRWRHEYLKQLLAQDDEAIGNEYPMQMVRLFAEYEPKGLLTFLRTNDRYTIEEALAVCQQQGLLEEQAYLLGREGRVDEALRILLERMGDVRRAVKFASEYQDPNLWEVLVSYVLAHPHLLIALLENLDELRSNLGEVGSDSGRQLPPPVATPAHVLQRLPPGTPVPRIATSVQRAIDSYQLSASLFVSCNRLSAEETRTRMRLRAGARKRGFVTAPGSWRCDICSRLLSAGPPLETPVTPMSSGAGNGLVMLRQRAVHSKCFQKSKAASAVSVAGASQ